MRGLKEKKVDTGVKEGGWEEEWRFLRNTEVNQMSRHPTRVPVDIFSLDCWNRFEVTLKPLEDLEIPRGSDRMKLID
ncbi:atp synthase subunit i [Lasius niger]|uniref:Atp synthase subunit i n=1 Tax=Lasius niger TaxID=67767 RepID=A0A0J7KYF3_LASNI|nr:atp synthase subunit i [Lasius niger]